MLGLAVGVDYALFIVSRYRHELIVGRSGEESAGRAIATAGSAVVFAGLTVIIALSALAVVRIPFLTWMGLGAAGAVFAAVLAALTLLPAVLGLVGERVLGQQGTRRRATPRPMRASPVGRALGTLGDPVSHPRARRGRRGTARLRAPIPPPAPRHAKR